MMEHLPLLRSLQEWEATIRPTSRWLLRGGLLLVGVGALLLLWSVSRAISVEVAEVGGTVMEGVVGDVRVLNPLLASLPAEQDIAFLIFAGLTRTNAKGKVVPYLAQSITQQRENPREYVVTLRPSLRFHDGTPLTAEDVAFTYRLAQDPSVAPFLAGRYSGVRVRATGTSTLTFTFPASIGPLQALDLLQLGILPAHLWKDTTPQSFWIHPANMRPVGAGPFAFAGMTRSPDGTVESVTLRAFPSAVFPPRLDSITFRLYRSAAAVQEALVQGNIDATVSLSSSTIASLPAATRKRLRRFVRPTDQVFALFYNYNQEPLLKHRLVRQALDTLIDRRQLVQQVLQGEVWEAAGPLPPLSPPLAASSTSPETKLKRASQLLQQAGWKQDDEGLWHAGKDSANPVRLTIITGTQPPLPSIAAFIARAWRAAGIPTEVKTYDTGTLTAEIIRPRLFGVLLFGMVTGKEGDLFPFWHSSQRNDPGLNVSQYANIAVDAALEKARRATTTEALQKANAPVIAALKEDLPASFLFTPLTTYAIRSDVQGIRLPPVLTAPSDRFANIEHWYRKRSYLWPFVAALLGATQAQPAPPTSFSE